MPTFRRTVAIAAPAEAVFAWHARPGALDRLLPPWSRVWVEREPLTGIADGSLVQLSVPFGPLRLPWVAMHYGTVAGRQFSDEQIEGPFRSWHHLHRMVPNGTGCVLEDEIHYDLPRGVRLLPVAHRRVQRILAHTFAFRHERTVADVLRHQRYADQKPLRIAITGASGLLGRRLVPFLRSGGHTVLRLLRSGDVRSRDAVRWDPQSGAVDVAKLGAVDAVIHLAGENIAGGRWTAARKSAIRASRVDATRALCMALAELPQPPPVFISASAVGYYGDRPAGTVSEGDAPGKGFLSEVCQAWEAAAEPLRAAGTRVVNLRLGMVIAGEGGALAKMLPLFRWGLGGRLGAGRQAMPWIAAEDAVGVVHQALFDARLAGPVNAVAPQHLANGEFTRTLAHTLHRPALLPVPGMALRLALGEMGRELLLEGAQVEPTRLQAAGFSHLYPDLAAALRLELGI